jgi:hypothetical protein
MVILEERRQPRCTANKWRRPPIDHGRRGILDINLQQQRQVNECYPYRFRRTAAPYRKAHAPAQLPAQLGEKSARIVNVILPEGHSRPFFKSA